jgi:hypothetical protein
MQKEMKNWKKLEILMKRIGGNVKKEDENYARWWYDKL